MKAASTPLRRPAALVGGLLLLAACASPTEGEGWPGWPGGTGGPAPAGPYTAVVDGAAFRDAAPGDLDVVWSAGTDAVVYALADQPFDYDADEPPKPADVLFAYPVTADGLGTPVVFTEGEDFPTTTSPYGTGVTVAPDGDLLYLVELADGGGYDGGSGRLALIRFDPAAGTATTVELDLESPYDDDQLIESSGLECSADGACSAVLDNGHYEYVSIAFDAATGLVTAAVPGEPAYEGEVTPDGRHRLLFGTDSSWVRDEVPPVDHAPYEVELLWVEYRTADGALVGPRVYLSETNARLVDWHLLADGTVLALLQEEPSGSATLLRVAPGDAEATVLADLGEAGNIGSAEALVADEDGGWVHVLASLEQLEPVLTSVDLASGDVATSGPLCDGDARFEQLLLTAAGAVTFGACEDRGTGVWLIGPER